MQKQTQYIEFNITLDTLCITLETIFPAFQPITWLIFTILNRTTAENNIKTQTTIQENYKRIHQLMQMKLKPSLGTFYAIRSKKRLAAAILLECCHIDKSLTFMH